MFLYVANWKMGFSFSQALKFCENNYDGFVDLSKLSEKKIVLCPSFTEIAVISELFGDSLVEVGAQDCSSHSSGAHTGQILAESLADIGCTYCIVGHSELRNRFDKGSKEVAKKVDRLCKCAITPILCVGEKKDEYELGIYSEVLKEQLLPVFEEVRDSKIDQICIAYEPIWAIGTGAAPKIEYIEKVFDFILDISKSYNFGDKIVLLYGGSVNIDTAQDIRSISRLGGFLIGSASLDFKKFEKIVKL